jgi:hypothetical protein
MHSLHHLSLGADIATRHEDMVFFPDLVQGRPLAEAGFILVLAVHVAPGVVGAGDHCDVVVRKLFVAAVDHGTELSGVDKKISPERLRNLALALLRARNQRQAGIMVL